MTHVQATVCAKFGLPCIIYMGAKDMERQALNVFRMRLLGAEVRPPFSHGLHQAQRPKRTHALAALHDSSGNGALTGMQ